MKLFVANFSLLLAALGFSLPAAAQTAVSGRSSDTELQTLTKKIDEQNMKIDALSQQILKLEQQISTLRPGIMIGESTPTPSAPAPVAVTGSSHTVAKGETLTSIAKAYKVGVQELQRFNHIENDRALQIGQTIQIPIAGQSPSPSPAGPNQ